MLAPSMKAPLVLPWESGDVAALLGQVLRAMHAHNAIESVELVLPS